MLWFLLACLSGSEERGAAPPPESARVAVGGESAGDQGSPPPRAASSTVQITVVDENNEPIPNAEVSIGADAGSGERRATTLDDGTVAFTRVEEGRHHVKVKSAQGDRSMEIDVAQRAEQQVVQVAPEGEPSLWLDGGRKAWIVPMDGSATWCSVDPDTGRKAMEVRSRGTQGFDIVIVGKDGGVKRTLVRPGDQSNPRWSLDGKRLVFHEVDDDGYRVIVYDLDTDTPHTVDVGLTPSWSPDGSQVVYARAGEGDDWNLWIAPADGGEPRQLTTDPAREQYPSWGRVGDEERIVFAGRLDGPYEIWSIRPDGSDPQRLGRAPSPEVRLLGPQPSPDGKWLAWWANGPAGNSVWFAPATGGHPERLADAAANPTWAQDDRGLVVYFDAKTQGRPQVYWTKM